jgi:hypothetical protein
MNIATARNDMAAYLRLWLPLILLLLILAAIFNYLMDPYGLYRPQAEGMWKPHAGSQGELVKPYQAIRQPLGTLILGNSRAEVGFDPDDSAWQKAARPVFNMGIPGKGPRTARRLFEHVLAQHPPGLLVLGVDFLDFPIAPQARPEAEPALGARLLTGPAGQANPRRWIQVWHDRAATLLSLDALTHSLDTWRQRGRPGVPHLTQSGFNPMHDYQRMAAAEGYHNLFRQRDREYLRTLARKPRNLFLAGSRTSPGFEDIQAILQQARARRIPVQLVIYPYHARLLESLQIQGLWPLFEEWKRELARLASNQGDSVQLWDFSGYHVYATEPVPVAGDRASEVRWYWESGHFKSSLGHLMLERMRGNGDPALGHQITPANLEQHLSMIRQEGAAYRSAQPGLALDLERLAR